MNQEKLLNVEMNISKGTFKSDNGEEVDYIICEAEINGEKIKFAPRAEDKKLFNYLINQKIK